MMNGTFIFIFAVSFALVAGVMTIMSLFDLVRNKSKRDAKMVGILAISCALCSFTAFRNYEHFAHEERVRELKLQERKIQIIRSCKLLPELEDRIVCMIKADR